MPCVSQAPKFPRNTAIEGSMMSSTTLRYWSIVDTFVGYKSKRTTGAYNFSKGLCVHVKSGIVVFTPQDKFISDVNGPFYI
jgi:hypothetical protein